jgi:hypothetical protein
MVACQMHGKQHLREVSQMSRGRETEPMVLLTGVNSFVHVRGTYTTRVPNVEVAFEVRNVTHFVLERVAVAFCHSSNLRLLGKRHFEIGFLPPD